MAEMGACEMNVDPDASGLEEMGFTTTPETRYIQDALTAGLPWLTETVPVLIPTVIGGTLVLDDAGHPVMVPLTQNGVVVRDASGATVLIPLVVDGVPVLDADGAIVYEQAHDPVTGLPLTMQVAVAVPSQRQSCTHVYPADLATFTKGPEILGVLDTSSWSASLEDGFAETDQLTCIISDETGYYIAGVGYELLKPGQLLCVEQTSGTEGAAVVVPQRYFMVDGAPEIDLDTLTITVHAVEWTHNQLTRTKSGFGVWGYMRAAMVQHAEELSHDGALNTTALTLFGDAGWYQTWVGIAWAHLYEALNGRVTVEGDLRNTASLQHLTPYYEYNTVNIYNTHSGNELDAVTSVPGSGTVESVVIDTITTATLMPAYTRFQHDVVSDAPTLLSVIRELFQAVAPAASLFQSAAPYPAYLTYRGDGTLVINTMNRRMTDMGLTAGCGPIAGTIRVPVSTIVPKFSVPSYQRVVANEQRMVPVVQTYDTVAFPPDPPIVYALPASRPFPYSTLAMTGIAERTYEPAQRIRLVEQAPSAWALPIATAHEADAAAETLLQVRQVAPPDTSGTATNQVPLTQAVTVAMATLNERWAPYSDDETAKILVVDFTLVFVPWQDDAGTWESQRTRAAQAMVEGLLRKYAADAYTLTMKVDSAFPLTALMQEVQVAYQPEGFTAPVISGAFALTAITQPFSEEAAEWTLGWRYGG